LSIGEVKHFSITAVYMHINAAAMTFIVINFICL